MIYSLEQIKGRIAPVAEKYRLPRVYLFGSYARGEATDNSDIDLLIDRSQSAIDGKGLLGMAAVYEDLRTALGKELDIVTISALRQDDSRAARRFSETILKERVALYERG